MGIRDGHRIGLNVMTNNVTDGGQRFTVDIAEIRQRFAGNIQRQFGLPGGDHFFFIFHALHQ
ncbi:hypothetical protein D3C81_2190960 [compost metagenome]